MNQNSTIKTYIKSLYEKISLQELTVIANSSKGEILEQKLIYQSFLAMNKRTENPSRETINSILSFSKNQA